MVVSVVFALVVLLAAGVWVGRGIARRHARRAAATGPGSGVDLAIHVRSFADIDDETARRRCTCGERLRATGEGAREVPPRRYRFARLACDECEEETVLWFDVTEALQ